ncbi:MAG TPA: hypothetical protein VN841_16260 [Bryobacteraceae bacterium]|nr:hypothetical protein [Bryobacteraceae bacterium]
MPDNPVATAVKPVLYAAAHAVAGPAAALALPLIAAAAVLAQDHLGPIGKAAATVLSALSINLGSTAAGKLAEALDPHSNHDIEILTAAAVQAALQAVRSKNPGPSITTADFDPWFELWHTRLERALKEPADAASLFHSDHPADPVGLALSEREKWWPAFKPLLLRWAAEEKQYRKVTAPDRGVAVPDTSSMPDALDQLLSQQLLDFAQYSQDMLVREDRHKREWIAYQQRFFKEIARRTREQDANVSGAFERLADVLLSELQVLKHSLGQDRQGITVHEKLDELRSLHRRSVDPADPTKVSVAKLPTVNPLLIGREHELKQLDAAWGTPEKPNPNIRLVSIVAYGGVGKTSLALNWWHARACQGAPGAQRVLGWSFYSQGAAEDRQASADPFLDHALRQWFSLDNPPQDSWQRGEKLAGLLRQERTLLILDGLEPIQFPPGPQHGRLKDPGMVALLKELAAHSPGLCVCTSRLPLTDLEDYDNVGVLTIDLDNLTPASGAEYLKQLGVQGPIEELQQASEEFDNHALALTLLGTLLVKRRNGDIRKRDTIPSLFSDPKKGGHARRVYRQYEVLFKGKPELDVLRILGLFDRPADPGALRILREL